MFDEWDDNELVKLLDEEPDPTMSLDDAELRAGLRDTLAFVLRATGGVELLSLTDYSRPTAEVMLKEAFTRLGHREGYVVENVDCEVEATRIPVSNLLRALEEGRELPPTALRLLLDLDDVDTRAVQDEIRRQLVEETGGAKKVDSPDG